MSMLDLALEKFWLSWFRAGAPRDRKGKPVLPGQNRRNGEAA